MASAKGVYRKSGYTLHPTLSDDKGLYAFLLDFGWSLDFIKCTGPRKYTTTLRHRFYL